jgi:PhnB protein
MSLNVFINFDGDCRLALEFYANVFELEIPENIMTYGQVPDSGFAEADQDRILYANLPILGSSTMFSDCPSNSGYVKGTNIAITLGIDSTKEIERIFNALSDGGDIDMPLGKTFFSELYGMLTDKFGITWQLSLTPFN